ncbi:MAG: hypothetical protein WB297_14525, partial [Actinomycetota bacterium]
HQEHVLAREVREVPPDLQGVASALTYRSSSRTALSSGSRSAPDSTRCWSWDRIRSIGSRTT